MPEGETEQRGLRKEKLKMGKKIQSQDSVKYVLITDKEFRR